MLGVYRDEQQFDFVGRLSREYEAGGLFALCRCIRCFVAKHCESGRNKERIFYLPPCPCFAVMRVETYLHYPHQLIQFAHLAGAFASGARP